MLFLLVPAEAPLLFAIRLLAALIKLTVSSHAGRSQSSTVGDDLRKGLFGMLGSFLGGSEEGIVANGCLLFSYLRWIKFV